MKNLLLSGKTLTEWNFDDILQTKELSNKELFERIEWYDLDNKIGPNCSDQTYLEIEHYNSFIDKRYK